MALYIEKLNIEQVRFIYEKSMLVDFPDSERKPLNMILNSIEAGTMDALGLFEDGDADDQGHFEAGEILGYAFFCKKGMDYLFDYLAMFESKRNSGRGTEFLRLIGEYYKDALSIVGEVEDPDCALDKEAAALQRRRLNFYLRNGYIDTGVRVLLFGVDYIVLELNRDKPHSREEIIKIYKNHYKAILPWWLYLFKVRIKK